MEGIADAGEDRNIQYANMHEDALNTSINEHRHKDIKGSAWGYNTSSSAWKRDEDRAIYAATRIHSGMSDPNVIPDRVELVKEQHGNFTPPANSALGSYTTMSIHNQDNTDLANDTLLGKLYHEHKHVRDGLDQLGFGRLGAQAAEKHASRMSDAALAAEEAKPDETRDAILPGRPTASGAPLHPRRPPPRPERLA